MKWLKENKIERKWTNFFEINSIFKAIHSKQRHCKRIKVLESKSIFKAIERNQRYCGQQVKKTELHM